jgi:catechol 2,3-dioxygenase-like lactoylglutathione lyase family enzyme
VPVNVRFHHIGITVTNLERSLEFYKTAFDLDPGVTFKITAGPSRVISLGLPEHKQRVAMLPVGDVVIELIEITPNRRPADGRQDDAGYAYPAFEVDDLEATYQALLAKGFEFNSPPMASHAGGPAAGSLFCILKDPDGKNIELMQIGPGLTREALYRGVASGASIDTAYVM